MMSGQNFLSREEMRALSNRQIILAIAAGLCPQCGSELIPHNARYYECTYSKCWHGKECSKWTVYDSGLAKIRAIQAGIDPKVVFDE